MPANSRSTKPARKASKKPAKKASKKPAKKASKKVAKKVAKKAARKVARKTARRPQGARKKLVEVPAERRHEMIARAAYYRAERRHFQGGDPVADWLYCEKEVDALLSKTIV